MRWALLVLLGFFLAPILVITYQMAFVNGYYDSSRCGTQRYVRYILTADLSEYSYDEWEIGRRWEQAHGRNCPEDDWQLVKAREPVRLFGDWPELNRIVAKQYDLSAIAALIQKGADPNNADRYGRNALHWAYAADKSEFYRRTLVQILINAGANEEAKDEDELRPGQWVSATRSR